MSEWSSTRAPRVLRALERLGWRELRRKGSHRTLVRNGARYLFAFHDREEIGPKMLARIGAKTGLTPADL